jgi:DNA-binding NtrC family response regulator
MRILIVEDDPQQASQLAEAFQKDAMVAANLETAIEAVRACLPDLIVLDAFFPPRSGRNVLPAFMAGRFLDALDAMFEGRPHARPDVILISGAEDAAQEGPLVGAWLQAGRISDVLPKGPRWTFLQAILRVKAERPWNRRRLRSTLEIAEEAFEALEAHGILTRAPEMTHVWKRVCDSARSGLNTFIYAETGCGKELVAKAIAKVRKCSRVSVCCRQFPPSSFENALFGTVRGAFDGAEDRTGWIEKAGHGVLFMDEFCWTPFDCQPALLRVLESDTREFSRLGETKPRQAGCMFVFADIMHPLSACEGGEGYKLLVPLANRVSSLTISIPPLRERRGDIPLLMDAFLSEINNLEGKKVSLEPEIYELFQAGELRLGNVRSLKSLIQCMVVSLDGRIGLGDVSRHGDSAIDRKLFETEVGIDLNRRLLNIPAEHLPP